MRTKITYEILDTCTDENRAILEDYWLLEKNKPVFKVAELLEKYQLSSTELPKIVRENSFAKRDDYKCSNCQYQVKFGSRTNAIAPNYSNDTSKYNRYRGLCHDCVDEIDRQDELLREQEKQRLMAEQIERDRTVPHAMYDGWQPYLTNKSLFNSFGVELKVSTLLISFIRYYKRNSHIKFTTGRWNDVFFKHCERHANWEKERLGIRDTNTKKQEVKNVVKINSIEASNKWRWDSEPTYTINSIVTNKK